VAGVEVVDVGRRQQGDAASALARERLERGERFIVSSSRGYAATSWRLGAIVDANRSTKDALAPGHWP
jgi:hypothetical protein